MSKYPAWQYEYVEHDLDLEGTLEKVIQEITCYGDVLTNAVIEKDYESDYGGEYTVYRIKGYKEYSPEEQAKRKIKYDQKMAKEKERNSIIEAKTAAKQEAHERKMLAKLQKKYAAKPPTPKPAPKNVLISEGSQRIIDE